MDAATSSGCSHVRFYERLGFEIVAEIEMPNGGPPVWMMWRKPGS